MTVRDRLFIDETEMHGFVDGLRAADINEALVISTPERVEILALHSDCEKAASGIAQLMADHAGLDPTLLKDQMYVITDGEAVRHLFAATAALDDVVIGEPRFSNELRTSHRRAAEEGMDGPGLRALMAAALEAAERVNRETGFDKRPATISGAAIRVARDLHGDLSRCTGLLVGVGEMGEVVAGDMLAAGLADLTVVHGSEQRAERMARALNCHMDTFDQLPRLLTKSDIVITALNTRRYCIDVEQMTKAIAVRRHKPVLLIDTGVPGDVDPAVDQLEDAFRYTLDDLERVATEGRALRAADSEVGWTLLEREVAAYLKGHGKERIEEARRQAVSDSGGDADTATRLLIDRLAADRTQSKRKGPVAWFPKLFRWLFGRGNGDL